jgi:hypothetical protein
MVKIRKLTLFLMVLINVYNIFRSGPGSGSENSSTDPEPAKSFGSLWIRIHNTEGHYPDPTKKVRIRLDSDLQHCFEAKKSKHNCEKTCFEAKWSMQNNEKTCFEEKRSKQNNKKKNFFLKGKVGSKIAKKIEAKRCEMKRKNYFLVSKNKRKLSETGCVSLHFASKQKFKKSKKGTSYRKLKTLKG